MIVNNWLSPISTTYFRWTIILKILNENYKFSEGVDVNILFNKYKRFFSRNDNSISFNKYLIVLDWLYLIEVIESDKSGNIKLK